MVNQPSSDWDSPEARDGGRVTILVRIADDGMPADPGPARVRPGAELLWKATGPNAHQFLGIKFTRESADARDRPLVASEKDGDHRVARCVAAWKGDAPREFGYAILTRNGSLDPAVIIDPK